MRRQGRSFSLATLVGKQWQHRSFLYAKTYGQQDVNTLKRVDAFVQAFFGRNSDQQPDGING